MSTKTHAAAKATAAETSGESTLPEYTPGTYYDVTLSRSVEFPPGSGNFMKPGETHHVDGAFIPDFGDAVSGAVAVET